MRVSNPGLAFNKSVFKDLVAGNRTLYRGATDDLHRALFKEKLGNKWEPLAMDCAGTKRRPFKKVELQIAWPGMMMGLGYGHGAKTEAEKHKHFHPHETEVKTGFYFDFTTGLPVLPGSTVKGILRSFFPGRIGNSTILKRAVTERLINILNEIFVEKQLDWNAKMIEVLENAIFEGFEVRAENQTTKKVFFSSLEQDVFLEAIPCKGTNAKVFNTNDPEKEEDVFIGEDVLTPHEHPLRNPVPIKHLKLLPGVTMRFQFLLNSKGGLTDEEKRTLFSHLLCEFGAGARKGTGFGQFIDPQKSPFEMNTLGESDWYIPFQQLERHEFESSERVIDYDFGNDDNRPPERPNLELVQISQDWPEIASLERQSSIEGIVLESKNGNAKVQLYVKGQKEIKNVSGVKDPVRSVIKLVITEFSGSIKKGNYQIDKVIKKK